MQIILSNDVQLIPQTTVSQKQFNAIQHHTDNILYVYNVQCITLNPENERWKEALSK